MTTVTREREAFAWNLSLQWLLAASLGMAVGSGVGLMSFWMVGEQLMDLWGRVPGYLVGAILFGAGIGLGLGGSQALVLGRRTTAAGRWLWASLAAGIVGGLLTLLVGSFFGENPSSLGVGLAGAAMGLCIGGGQWLAIRNVAGPAGWWVVANIVGMGLAFFVAHSLGHELLVFGSAGLTQGAISAVAAGWLFGGLRV